MKIGSLCTGYGGFDIAAENIFDAKTVWYSEFDKHASKIMEHHQPNLQNLGDLTKVDWSLIEHVDILTAGYPCQPFSQAGKRKGTNDERHIWPHIATAIGILRPSFVILENVRGHLNLGFDEVLGSLTSLGYDASWDIIRASDIGAPHRRERLFIVAQRANANSDGQHYISQQRQEGHQRQSQFIFKRMGETLTNANGYAYEQSQRAIGTIQAKTSEIINRPDRQVNWGRYQDAIERWEKLTRPSPSPILNNRLNPKFVEWMMGLPDGWVTNLNLSETQQLKILGNGIVPQQAAFAINHIIKRLAEKEG